MKRGGTTTTMTAQRTLAEASRPDTTTTANTSIPTGDDGNITPCTCPWPDNVQRVDVVIGRAADGHERTRIIDQCQDCNGAVQ